MSTEHGWVSHLASGDNSHLSEATRRRVERSLRERRERRGQLLAVVEVRVYENGAHAQVSRPPGAALGAKSSTAAIAEIVSRARRELADWR